MADLCLYVSETETINFFFLQCKDKKKLIIQDQAGMDKLREGLVLQLINPYL